jgi:hypothetical protein
MVGLHHIVRPLASCVVACKTVHESPAAGAWPYAVPAPNAPAATVVNAVADIRNRSLLMTDIS